MTDSPTGQALPADQDPRDQPTEAESRMRDALGPDLGDDAVQAAGAVAAKPERSKLRILVIGIAAILVLQVVGLIVSPPLGCEPDTVPCSPSHDLGFNFPGDAIKANFELPAPHVVWPPDHHAIEGILVWDVSVSASLFTAWIIMLVILVLAVLLSRGIRMSPRKPQNALEYVYEGLANFATSLGGPKARVYVPIFVTFFIFILLSNWSGLVPFVGRVPQLRAPTSDVNITIGLALVAFAMFHIEGVRKLGFRGYFGKFFTLAGFKDGIGAGIIALFVGVLEFFLEFVKPVTLSMRLFGNIYAGEIALGVVSALTIFLLPVAMLGLEVLLNFMQALIFSVLALMFTLAAIEGHHDDEHEGEGAASHLPEGNIEPEIHAQAAHA